MEDLAWLRDVLTSCPSLALDCDYIIEQAVAGRKGLDLRKNILAPDLPQDNFQQRLDTHFIARAAVYRWRHRLLCATEDCFS